MSDALAPRRFVSLFLGVAVCVMLVSLFACATNNKGDPVTLNASLAPSDYWVSWLNDARNPMIKPQPSLEDRVLKPLKNSYESLALVLGWLNNTGFAKPAYQALVLKYMAAANKTPEEKKEFRLTLDGLYNGDSELRPELNKNYKALMSK